MTTNTEMRKAIRKVAVIAGGWSGEREVSLASGQSIFETLQSAGQYETCFIDVTRDLWRFAHDIKAADPDVALVVTHGIGGEDGVLQGVLEMAGIPYTHSNVTASALAMDKVLSRIIFERIGIHTPKWTVCTIENMRQEKEPLPFPYVMKPINEGSSLGVYIIHNEHDLEKALTEWKYGEVLLEEYIKGKEVQCAVLNGKALGAIEIKPKNAFFDYEAKYTKGAADHIMPAPIPAKDYQHVLDESEKAFKSLGCNGVARLDFMYGEDGQTYLLELNNIPGMTSVSLVPEIASYVGMSYLQIINALIESATTQS